MPALVEPWKQNALQTEELRLKMGHGISLLGHVTGWKPIIHTFFLRIVQPIDFIETQFIRQFPNYNTYFKSGLSSPDTTRCTAWCSVAPSPSGPLPAPSSWASRARCGWGLPAVPQSRRRRTSPWRRIGIHQPQKGEFHGGFMKDVGIFNGIHMQELRSNED